MAAYLLPALVVAIMTASARERTTLTSWVSLLVLSLGWPVLVLSTLWQMGKAKWRGCRTR